MGSWYALQVDRVDPFQFSKAFREGVGRHTTLRATGTWTTWERLKGDKAALLWGSQWLRRLRKKNQILPKRAMSGISTETVIPEEHTELTWAWDLGSLPITSRWPITPKIFASLIPPPNPPISQFRRTELWNWKGKELTRIRPFFHPTPNLSATSLVYQGDGRGVARRSSTCDFSPYDMRVLNRPRLLVKGLAHFQDVLKE